MSRSDKKMQYHFTELVGNTDVNMCKRPLDVLVDFC